MAILIDPPQWWHRERWWGHLVSDQSFDELHAFAAELVPSKELVRRLTDAGLRRPKGRPALGAPDAAST